MKVGALIIAVVKNEPMNQISALKKVGDLTAIQRIVLTLKQAGIDRIYILSNQAQEMKKEIAKWGLIFIPVNVADSNTFAQIKIGLHYLLEKEHFIFLVPASYPLFKAATIKALQQYKDLVSIPVNHGDSGYPIYISAKLLPALLALEVSGSVEDALKKVNCPINKVVVEDRGVTISRTDHNNFKYALDHHSLNQLSPEIRLRIRKEKPFLGPGPKQLLILVTETGSLKEACEFMGISYSKGRAMINVMEQQLGYEVLERKQGGETGGSSAFTKKGSHLLTQYLEYEKRVKDYALQIFDEYFNDIETP